MLSKYVDSIRSFFMPTYKEVTDQVINSMLMNMHIHKITEQQYDDIFSKIDEMGLFVEIEDPMQPDGTIKSSAIGSSKDPQKEYAWYKTFISEICKRLPLSSTCRHELEQFNDTIVNWPSPERMKRGFAMLQTIMIEKTSTIPDNRLTNEISTTNWHRLLPRISKSIQSNPTVMKAICAAVIHAVVSNNEDQLRDLDSLITFCFISKQIKALMLHSFHTEPTKDVSTTNTHLNV